MQRFILRPETASYRPLFMFLTLQSNGSLNTNGPFPRECTDMKSPFMFTCARAPSTGTYAPDSRAMRLNNSGVKPPGAEK